jgi:hypothetical protein
MAIPIGVIGPLVDIYRRAWRDAGHAGEGEVMIAFHMFCHENGRMAREIARAPFGMYFRALAEATSDWTKGQTSKDYRDYDKAMTKMATFTVESQIESGGAWIGTPDEIKSIIRRTIDSIGRFEHASLQINFANLDAVQAATSMRLFAGEVMPEFSAAHGLRQHQLASRLA